MAALSDVWAASLPHRPYCTDDFSHGVRVRSLSDALLRRYIQPNGPSAATWLVFDVDRPGGAFAAQDAGLPDPTAVLITPHNRHAHVLYGLENRVCTTSAARQKPMRYLASIEAAYREVLGADVGYSGLMTKNAVHPHWLRLYGDNVGPLYTLDMLAEAVDLSSVRPGRDASETAGFGRNCMLFERLRVWAYRAIRRHRGPGRPDAFVVWSAEVFAQAAAFNAEFPHPLTIGEVKAIAKSTARFCWKKDPECHQAFLERQAFKGRMGGKVSGAVRRAASEDVRVSARLMRASGCTMAAIAAELGVTERTVYLWCKSDTLK